MRNKLYSKSCALVVEMLESRTFLTTTPFVAAKLNTGVTFNRFPAPAITMDDPTDNHLDLAANFTVESWVKFDSLPQKDEGFAFVSKDAGQGITNKWIFGYANNTAAPNKTFFHITNADGGGVWATSNEWTPQIGVWYHLAVSKTTQANGSNVYRFFRNGALVSDTTTQIFTTQLPDSEGDFLLGRAEYDPGVRADPNAEPPVDEVAPSGFNLRGALDDVRVWNVARTGTQINTNYTKELVGSESGLVGYWKLNEGSGTTVDDATANDTTGTLIDYLDFAVPELHSNPTADAKLYINFTGDFLPTWGSEKPLQIDPYDSDDDITTFSGEELAGMVDIWQMVSEAYSPFNIDVTTSAPAEIGRGKATQIDVGGDGQWFAANKGHANVAAGVAFLNGFTSTDGEHHIGFAFAYNMYDDADNPGQLIRVAATPNQLGLVVSHESGHTFGLSHQSVYAPDGTRTDEYHPGFNDIDIVKSKGPIMGAPYGSDRKLWWNGTSSSRLTIQDDLSILAGANNGFGYRLDEYGDTIAAATPIALTPDADTLTPTYIGTGIITKTSDIDVLKFTAAAGPVTIQMGSAYEAGEVSNMLDSDIELRDAAGNLLASTSEGIVPSINFTIPSTGNYYLLIKSHGIYGDIGMYNVKITGVTPPNGKVNGTVFGDVNNDGTKQAGELGLAGRVVFLDLNNDGSLSGGEQNTTTLADGSYAFSGLVDGTYKVRVVVPSGYALSTPVGSAVIASSNTVGGMLIGLYLLPAGVVSGTVFSDVNSDAAKQAGEGVLSGTTVYLDLNNDTSLTSGEPSTTSAADGSYSFTGLAAGTYKVRAVTPAGSTLTTAVPSVTLADNAATSTGNLIGFNVISNASIAGTVYSDANQNAAKDGGENGISGQVVFIDTNGDGSLTSGEKSTSTAADGSYSFTGLPAGSYKVRVVLASGVTQTTAVNNVALATSQTLSGVLIGLYVAPVVTTGTISGVVFNDANNDAAKGGSEVGMNAVVVFLDTNGDGALTSGEKLATTNSSGAFTFSALAAGTYKLRVTKPAGYNQSTALLNVTVSAGQTSSGNLIGLNKPTSSTASISGTLFIDNNKDGTYNSGDSLVVSTAVFLDLNGNNALDAGEKSTTTNSSGKYTFSALGAGTYHVRRAIPSGYALSTAQIDVVLASAQVLTNKNIGVKKTTTSTSTASISGILFFDNNKDGVFNSGDVIQGSKTVFLDTNGNGILDAGEKSTTTNSTGNYSFTGLAAGTYKVRRTLPSGYKVTTLSKNNITVVNGQAATGVNIGTAYV